MHGRIYRFRRRLCKIEGIAKRLFPRPRKSLYWAQEWARLKPLLANGTRFSRVAGLGGPSGLAECLRARPASFTSA
jgi:hypothetical protein